MTEGILKPRANRLDTTADREALNRFVRINLDDIEVVQGDQKDPLKKLQEAQKERKLKEEKAEQEWNQKEQEKKQREFEKQLRQRRREEKEQQAQEAKEQQAQKAKEQPPPEGEEGKVAVTPEKFKEKLSQKKIKDELKMRRKKKKKRPKPEEIYTDTDRAAAAAMGSQDIKQSLRIKRREDRSKAMAIPEESEPTTFIALGNSEVTRGCADVAILFYNKALELDPDDKNSLVARSNCYLLLGQPANGLKDAESALAIDKSFIKGIYQKAESLYYLGDFEHSLMYFHRGLRLRPDHEGFQLGVQKAQKAIENAIGGSFFPGTRSPSPSALRSSRSQTRDTATPMSKLGSAKTPESKTSKTSTSTRTKSRQRSTLRPKTAVSKPSKVLRELQADKEYLDNLLNHPDLKCKNKDDDSEIIGYIKEAVDFLNTRQEFWRQQSPSCK